MADGKTLYAPLGGRKGALRTPPTEIVMEIADFLLAAAVAVAAEVSQFLQLLFVFDLKTKCLKIN